jgi:SAM-dependent methyltransferase
VLDPAYPRRVVHRLKSEVLDRSRQVIDLGCGARKFPGAIGVEIAPGPGIDVVHDLDRAPYPFADASADLVILRHVIEHLADVPGTVRECARILRPGGHLLALTPHFSDASSWIDPEHRWHLATRSLEEAAKGVLELAGVYVRLRKPWRRLGVERWLNRAPFQSRVPRPLVSWENDWCFLIRGGEMLCLLRRPGGGPALSRRAGAGSRPAGEGV